MRECDVCNEIDFHEIIDCIVSALDAKDPYTSGHSERVSDMVIVVCQLLGFNKDQIQQVHMVPHLHDIGKIGVPDSVLLKPGKLEPEEWEKLKKHPDIGARVIAICDSIDAITSNRCDRKAHDFDFCYEEIKKSWDYV